MGYRKAIEVLIKDYAIRKFPEEREKIYGKPLYDCLTDYIDHEKIKSIAKQATWLGNYQTHYMMKWEGKPLNDLKIFISLLIYFLEMDAEIEKLEVNTSEENPLPSKE